MATLCRAIFESQDGDVSVFPGIQASEVNLLCGHLGPWDKEENGVYFEKEIF